MSASAQSGEQGFVRFQSPVPSERGINVGVFGLVNMLGRSGALSDQDETFRVKNNAWYDTAYPDPAKADPAVYDKDINPLAVAWFKVSATELIERVAGYLEILARHGVDCVRVESTSPGRVIYEDDVQVVVLPVE